MKNTPEMNITKIIETKKMEIKYKNYKKKKSTTTINEMRKKLMLTKILSRLLSRYSPSRLTMCCRLSLIVVVTTSYAATN